MDLNASRIAKSVSSAPESTTSDIFCPLHGSNTGNVASFAAVVHLPPIHALLRKSVRDLDAMQLSMCCVAKNGKRGVMTLVDLRAHALPGNESRVQRASELVNC